jgi:hypothetical protein
MLIFVNARSLVLEIFSLLRIGSCTPFNRESIKGAPRKAHVVASGVPGFAFIQSGIGPPIGSKTKELSAMRKNRRLFLSLAMSALVGLIATEARAELISVTMTIGGGPSFVVDAVATPGPTTYSVDAPGLAALNGFLAAGGSEYSLISLGGSSNFPGNASLGNLVMTGEIHSLAGVSGNPVLTITETESNFTSPTGASGTLKSSSTGNFTNQPAGGGHTASSAFNATSTPTYSVLSSGIAVNPEGGTASVGIAPVSTLYTMTNVITFGLSPAGANDIVDSFGVTATVSANAVPEPSSLAIFFTSMSVPMVVVGLRHRRRAVRS